VKAPEVQLLWDFGENDNGTAHRTKLEEAHQAYLKTLLANSIRAKADDSAFLEKALDANWLWNEIAPAVKARAWEILSKSKFLEFTVSSTNKLTLSGWKENTVAGELGRTILADIPVFCFRVISIVEARDHAATAKVATKKNT
jgi:hypothetical protein